MPKGGVSGARDGPAHYITLLVNWKLGRLGCSVTAKEGERKEYRKDKKRAPWQKPEAKMAGAGGSSKGLEQKGGVAPGVMVETET